MFDEIPISTIKLPEGRFQTFHDVEVVLEYCRSSLLLPKSVNVQLCAG